MPPRPMGSRPFNEGLMVSTCEHPVLTKKRSLAWPIAERPLTTVPAVVTAVPE